MYRTKSVGPKIEPWGKPALTEYSCQDFASKTTQATYYWGNMKQEQSNNEALL